jgi:cytochrome c-type biogenesis protein CcmH
MRFRMISIGLALLALLLLPQGVFAQSPEEEELEKKAQEIYRSLMCPLCPGQTIAESQTELSRQMRELVKKKLRQGESKEEIIQYFVSRYGESILAEPRKKGWNLILWLFPGAFITLGATLVYLRLRRWSTPARIATEAPLEEVELAKYRERLEKELETSPEKL